MNYAGRLQRAGVNLNTSTRIYQIRNLPHNFSEIVESTPNINALLEGFGVIIGNDSERMAPFVAVAIDNMNAWLVGGTPPPRSWINGRSLDDDNNGVPDRIEFARADVTLAPTERPGYLLGQISTAGVVALISGTERIFDRP